MLSKITRQFGYHKLDNKLEDDSSSSDVDRTDDPTETHIATHLNPKQRNHKLLFLLGTTILLLLIACATLLALHLQLLHEVYLPPIKCGLTTDEAIAKGCEYDLLAKAWIPAACPSIGKEEYVKLSSGWEYYTEQVDGEVIDDISYMVGTHAMWWTTEREHLTHCAYLFVRMSSALSTRSQADYLISNHGHTKHCAMLMLNRTMHSPTLDRIYTRGGGYLGSC